MLVVAMSRQGQVVSENFLLTFGTLSGVASVDVLLVVDKVLSGGAESSAFTLEGQACL